MKFIRLSDEQNTRINFEEVELIRRVNKDYISGAEYVLEIGLKSRIMIKLIYKAVEDLNNDLRMLDIKLCID